MKCNPDLVYTLLASIAAVVFSAAWLAWPRRRAATTSCTSCSSDDSDPQSHYYCVNTPINSEYEILGNHDCFYDDVLLATKTNQSDGLCPADGTVIDITKLGDFVTPHLQPGEIAPIVWRRCNNNCNGNGGKIVSQYAFHIGLPPQLVPTLLNYTSHLGILDKFRSFTSTSPIPFLNTGNETLDDKPNGKFLTFGSNRWYAQRPAKKWASNMHWISPANERTHEEYLNVLFTSGGFHELLDDIGKALKLDGLVAYHLTFLAVSDCIAGYPHWDTKLTGGRVYNVIIPLLLEEDVNSELILFDDETGERGGYKYQVGMAALMGDDVIHGTLECDYTSDRNTDSEEQQRQQQHREWKHGGIMTNGKRSGMRLAATVYIADINDLNVKDVAERTLTQIFPMPDQNWLYAQRGRHWVHQQEEEEDNEEVVCHEDDDISNYMPKTKKEKKSENEWSGDVFIDKGRKRFWFEDHLEDCYIRAKEGKCESDVEETRKMCLKSCNVYIEDGPTSTKKLEQNDDGIIFQVCTQNRTGVETCLNYEDDTEIAGDFVVPKKNLGAGEMIPIVWRENGTQTTPYAFQVGLPPELTTELLKYCDELGVTDLFRKLVGDNPIEAPEDGRGHSGIFVTLNDGNRWYAQRPEKKWTSNMHWISPADEKTHEEYIKALARGNFDAVLDGIGKYLGFESLVAYHVTFLAVSHSEKGFTHRDTHDTDASVYNVIIPLIIDDEASPELEISDWDDDSFKGSLKYQIGTASMMGDEAMHGTQACDYREKKGIRMAATIYIADINELNYQEITTNTLTQIFPLSDKAWLWSQRGRHWGNGKSLKTDAGRKNFSFSDHIIDCEERAQKGMCESDQKVTREKCLKSCNVYEDDGVDDAWYVDVFDPKKDYEIWHYLNPFFDNHWDYKCVDSDDECQEDAERGLCLTEPDHMREIGCHRSCLFCLAPDSRDLFSLGETQVLESYAGDANEKAAPDPNDVLEIIVKTEQYLVNKVFVAPDHEHVRLSCRNYDEKCAIWAAQGYCKKERGFMGKTCPAACQDCLMIDYESRCPLDIETNAFDPGEMNEMFKRILKECGEDPSSFSSDNPPCGGTHPFGEITVISSPYDDMKKYLSEEGIKKMDEYSPVPWMLLVDGFLTEEECDKLIELGSRIGYERSTIITEDFELDGSRGWSESEFRTSESAFCGKTCRDDPVVEGLIKRMEDFIGIPKANYEDLQLVRYEVGQFYQEHHDRSEADADTVAGHRILTFFMYLNDVEEGGGTKFPYLDYIAKPKRGSALLWPSVTNDNLEEMDEWTFHEALQVTKGIKFGANAWIHLRDYQNVPEYC